MFSVVIPLFNKRAYVQRALDSVSRQSIEPAALPEIIVVNDGSTDGGDLIAKSQTDPRVRVIDQPNQGVSAARNAGIAAATQPFIAFLDADDRWLPEFLLRMRALIAAHPGAVLYGAGYATVRDGRVVEQHGIRASDLDGAATSHVAGPAGPVDFFKAMGREVVTHSSCIVAPKSAAVAVGGFPEGVSHTEDYLFWSKLALAGRVVLTAEPLTEYEVSVPGQAVEYWQRGYKERFDVLELHRFLAEQLRRRPPDGPGAGPSFAAYARRQLRTAVLQRFYWGNFSAVDRLWRELELEDAALGPVATGAACVARQPFLQPLAAGALAAVRGLRAVVRGAAR